MPDLQHQVWLLTLQGRLHTIPLANYTSPILDIGCGTGSWSIAIAKQNPDARVIATDLTPPNISPPPNLTIMYADMEKKWNFQNKFGFIHGRMLTSGIHNWPIFLANCWDHLAPGGWLELLDICHPFRAEVSSADNESSSFIKWGHIAEKCWAMNGLDYRATEKHTGRLRKLGFVDIHVEDLRWPLGEWPGSEVEQQIGRLTLSNFNTFLATAGVGIISQDPGISAQEARDLGSDAQQDLVNHCDIKHFYLTM